MFYKQEKKRSERPGKFKTHTFYTQPKYRSHLSDIKKLKETHNNLRTEMIVKIKRRLGRQVEQTLDNTEVRVLEL